VVALKSCFPLAVADSHGADLAMVVGVGVGGVVEEAESPFFNGISPNQCATQSPYDISQQQVDKRSFTELYHRSTF
nr:hypothetical protein [Tanacetum cinerariifolium]